jgi:riboflavin synthase
MERAVPLGERMGGHLVSGHVDCLARVTERETRGDSTFFRLAFPPAMGHLLVSKGSVALDGVSLTINECGADFFTVNVIPETLKATILAGWRPGRAVNLETDVVGKYVARMMETGWASGKRPSGEGKPAALTEEFLRNHGF